MMKTCRGCQKEFEITPDDKAFYEQVNAVEPRYCPPCRMQRRLVWRNERTLYRRKCDLCQKESVAIYPEQTEFPVYCAPCWWGDGWDAKEYALEYDPARPFFEQLKALQAKVPRIGLLSITSVNSDYTNNGGDNKNCYLLFAAEQNEDCMYGRLVQRCRDVVDGCFVYDSQLCYECLDCRQCYGCLFSERCQASTNLLFCFDMRDSQDCILSVNMRHAQYCILNQQYSKEEYEKKKKEILASYDSIQEAKKQFEELKANALVKYAFQTKCVNATGDYLFNCQDTKMVYDATSAKSCAYMADVEEPIDCYDGNNMYYKPERCLDMMGVLQTSRSKYCCYTLYSTDCEYCDNIQNCASCFGCIGIRKTNYAILNKTYTKEEYEKLLPEILKSMNADETYGDYLPPEISVFGYNETLANDLWPLTKEEALVKGFRWQDATTGMYGKETMKADALPKTIEETQDSITSEAIACETCGLNFRITPAELQFYRRLHLPLPRKDFECRLRERMAKRNPRTLWPRECQCEGAQSQGGKYANSGMHTHGAEKCGNKFESTYAPERSEVVYCEQCYQSEVA